MPRPTPPNEAADATSAFPLPDDEHWARAVVDSAPAAMIMIAADRRIVLVNRFAETVFGYETSEIVGQPIEVLVPERHRPNHPDHVAEFLASPGPRLLGVGREVTGVDKSGREFPVEIGLTPITTAGGTYVLATVIDITERKRLERESTVARLVQEAMLPRSTPDVAGLDMAGRSIPADATGGDFYDYIPLSAGRLGVSIGDASGHGFGAALIVAATRSYLRATARVQPELDEVLASTNALLVDDVPEGRFVTLFLAVVDAENDELAYCGAGHDAYVIGPDAAIRDRLHSTGPPLGWFPESNYRSQRVPFRRGDIAVLLTDGIEEALGPGGDRFGRERVARTLVALRGRSAREIVDGLVDAVRAFGGDVPQQDDLTVVVVKHIGE